MILGHMHFGETTFAKGNGSCLHRTGRRPSCSTGYGYKWLQSLVFNPVQRQIRLAATTANLFSLGLAPEHGLREVTAFLCCIGLDDTVNLAGTD